MPNEPTSPCASLIYQKADSTILNPDTNFGTSGTWTNTSLMVDGDGDTRGGKNCGGGGADQDPAIRFQGSGPTGFAPSSMVAVGVIVRCELVPNSSPLPYYDLRFKIQHTAGVLVEDFFIASNGAIALANIRKMFAPTTRLVMTGSNLIYCTVDVDGPETQTTTVWIHEVGFLYANRSQRNSIDG